MSGSGGDKAQRAAQASEAQRMASISNTQGQINRVFDDPKREADISDYVGALREYWGNDLGRQKDDTDRSMRFALARNGQIGGSTQVDQQARFADDYAKAVLQVEQKAQGQGASLRSADQDARARLISLSTSGLDATTAAAQSAQAMRANLESSQGSSMMASLQPMFSAYQTYADKSAERKWRNEADKKTVGLYAPIANSSNGGGYGGS